MSLNQEQKDQVASLLINQIRRKLNEYKAETTNMPFHMRLLGKDRMALFSFIQSINTTLGTSVFEQTAVIVAKPNFKQAVSQYRDFNNTICEGAYPVIQAILNDLRSGKQKPDKAGETRRIVKASSGALLTIKKPRIDLFLEAKDGTEYYFDLKTAKPNIGDFVGFKRQLMEWTAIHAAQNPKAKAKTMLAIPYNPYEPEPYDRWTLQGLFDIPNEILIAEIGRAHV